MINSISNENQVFNADSSFLPAQKANFRSLIMMVLLVTVVNEV